MNGSRYYGVRVEGAKFGVGFGSALAITISYSENQSDPVGNHRWNFELALCGLFCAFPRMTLPRCLARPLLRPSFRLRGAYAVKGPPIGHEQ